jgi:hypothetical protein
MTATNHALTGAAIATVIKQPSLALPLAFLSHFVCDALPHFDSGMEFGKKSMYVYLSSEFVVMLGLFMFIVGQGVSNLPFLMAASILAMSPDLIWLYHGLNKNLEAKKHFGPITQIHEKIQWSATKWGIVPEAFWAILMVSVILK